MKRIFLYIELCVSIIQSNSVIKVEVLVVVKDKITKVSNAGFLLFSLIVSMKKVVVYSAASDNKGERNEVFFVKNNGQVREKVIFFLIVIAYIVTVIVFRNYKHIENSDLIIYKAGKNVVKVTKRIC